MTPGEAALIVKAMFRMYPASNASEDTFKGWIEHLIPLDAAVATIAMGKLVLESPYLPAVSSFMDWYRKVVQDRRDIQPALPEGDPSWPRTPEQWERLGAQHRKLRAAEHPDARDTFAGKPLPRSKREFDGEWVAFINDRFGVKVEASP